MPDEGNTSQHSGRHDCRDGPGTRSHGRHAQREGFRRTWCRGLQPLGRLSLNGKESAAYRGRACDAALQLKQDITVKPIYIATFHQSKFGKLMGMTVPQIVDSAIQGACRQIGTVPAALDVGSIGAACNFSLNEQGLLAGPMADTPGKEGKPIEAVENACASGGQAVLSVIQKLQLGMGETGIAVGYEKMRDAEGKMDGKLIGKVLGYFSHPDERAGKVFVFPHIFAEVMREYMDAYGVTERDLASIAVQEYANAQFNPWAQMNKVRVSLDQALTIEGDPHLVHLRPGVELR